MAVDYMLLGNVTSDSVTVSLKFDGADTSVRLAISEFSDMSSATTTSTSDAALTAGEYRLKLTATGLTPRTRYYVQAQISGTPSGDIGEFWTPWEEGVVGSFPFVHVSCMDTQASDAFPATHADAVHLAAQTGIFAFIGDFHYLDDGTTATDAGRAALLDGQIEGTNKNRLFNEQANLTVHDDHDGFGNDTGGTEVSASVVTAQTNAWDAVFPHYPYGTADTADTDGIYHAFQVGRFRVIVTDLRTYRTTPAADPYTDNTKTMMGANQLQWFKDQLDLARDNGSIAVIWCDTQVLNAEYGEGTSTGDTNTDVWWAFDYERQAILDYMNDLSGGARPKVIDVTGDQHAIGRKRNMWKGGTDNGQYPDTFCAASLNRAGGLTRGERWDAGPNTQDNVFGRLCLRDGPEGFRIQWGVWNEPFSTTSSTVEIPIDYAAYNPPEMYAANTVTFADATTLGIRKAA